MFDPCIAHQKIIEFNQALAAMSVFFMFEKVA